jgi:two-component system, OmpR family, phosphate regulon sensor histidine kinase PhoR
MSGKSLGMGESRARPKSAEVDMSKTIDRSRPTTGCERHETALQEANREVDRLKALLEERSGPTLYVAHELRSPIASLLNTLSVLVQGDFIRESALRDEMLRLARDRAQAMLALVNDLLHLGNIEYRDIEREIEAVKVDDVLWQVVPALRIKAMLRGVELELDVAKELPAIAAQSDHIERLLFNLIDNGVKYTDPGGVVAVRLHSEGNRVVGVVEDTGIGIAPEDLPRLFTKFYRAPNAKEVEPYGTGLGLVTVKRIVGLYGGRMSIDSELKRGSTFSFSFPSITSGSGLFCVLPRGGAAAQDEHKRSETYGTF